MISVFITVLVFHAIKSWTTSALTRIENGSIALINRAQLKVILWFFTPLVNEVF